MELIQSAVPLRKGSKRCRAWKARRKNKAEADAKWWNEEWLKFHTVSLDEAGAWHYWDVPPDSGV